MTFAMPQQRVPCQNHGGRQPPRAELKISAGISVTERKVSEIKREHRRVVASSDQLHAARIHTPAGW